MSKRRSVDLSWYVEDMINDDDDGHDGDAGHDDYGHGDELCYGGK